MGCGGACAVLVVYVMMFSLPPNSCACVDLVDCMRMFMELNDQICWRLHCPGALLSNGHAIVPSCCCKHEYKLSNEIGIELLQQVKKIIPLQLASYNIL